jgi:type IV fimbrial biogenesis protein FimT
MSSQTPLKSRISAVHRPLRATRQSNVAQGQTQAKMHAMKNRAQGMTIVELMIALLILSILMGLAIPSFREMTSNSRTTAAINGLVTAMTLARSEALKRASPAIVCASADSLTCSGANDWATGWLVTSDTNGDGAVDANEIIQTWPSLDAGMTASTVASDRVVYSAMGMAQPAAAITFQVQAPHCTGNHRSQTVVSAAGSLQTSKIACL